VQPHSGSQANQAVYAAMLKPGDTHARHVARARRPPDARLVGQSLRQALQRRRLRARRRRGDRLRAGRALAHEHKPKVIVAGASAYSLRIDFKRFREIADAVGAYLFVDMAHYAGLIAANLYPSPVGIADFVTSTTHKTLRGPRGGLILSQAEHEKILNSAIFPGIQGGPLMHVIAAKAVAFKEAMTHEFRACQAQVLDNAS
jgi:glycine hydroxymethyltransferase